MTETAILIETLRQMRTAIEVVSGTISLSTVALLIILGIIALRVGK